MIHFNPFQKLLLILSISCFFVSCGKHYTTNPSILEAEKISESNPESAMVILNLLIDSTSLSTSDFAAWNLIYSYSYYISDSADMSLEKVQKALDYYENSGLQKQEGMAHYLYGYALLQQNRVDEAVRSFKKATISLINSSENNLLGLSYYYMGYHYSLDAVYDKAVHYMKLAAIYFQAHHSEINLAFAFRELGNAYDLGRYPVDSALYYFGKSKELLLAQSDTAGYYDVLFYEAITKLNKTNRFEEARDALIQVYRYYDSDPYYHNKLSFAYARTGQADSALYYYNKALPDTTNIYSKMAVNLAGAYANMANKDYKKAAEGFIQYNKFKSMVFNETQKNQLYRIDKGFDLSEKEKENATLKERQRNIAFLFSGLTVVLLALFVTIIVLWIKRKHERQNFKIEKQRLLVEIEQKRLALLTKIQNRANNTLGMSRIEMKMKGGTQNIDLLLEEILKRSVIPEQEWTEYINEVDMVCNYHITDLALRFPTLTNADKIVIALSSMKIDITDSCALLGMNKNTMYKRRNTIKERLGLDKTIDFEIWILNEVEKRLTKDQQNKIINRLITTKKKESQKTETRKT